MDRVLPYKEQLKDIARILRKNMTKSEQVLWSRLRRKQVHGVQFYRQKVVGGYIVDFYASEVALVVEVDGSQHGTPDHAVKDNERDRYLQGLGIQVLRYGSRAVLKETDSVLEDIYLTVQRRLSQEIPLGPPFRKGDGFEGSD